MNQIDDSATDQNRQNDQDFPNSNSNGLEFEEKNNNNNEEAVTVTDDSVEQEEEEEVSMETEVEKVKEENFLSLSPVTVFRIRLNQPTSNLLHIMSLPQISRNFR
jgi:hypothetical protein